MDTIVRVFTVLGAQQLASHAGAFLARRAWPGPAAFPIAAPAQLPAIAVDGKAVRGAADEDELVPYLLAAATHAGCAVIAERLIGRPDDQRDVAAGVGAVMLMRLISLDRY